MDDISEDIAAAVEQAEAERQQKREKGIAGMFARASICLACGVHVALPELHYDHHEDLRRYIDENNKTIQHLVDAATGPRRRPRDQEASE